MTADPREARCPYPGLEAFTAENRHFFFGRVNDTQLLISNLYASALTVVYGASGVGKTSVLLAGVVPEVEREGEALIVVHRTWQDAARARALGGELARKVGEALGTAPAIAEGPLDVVAEQLAAAWRRPIFLVFDQFEEYFLYNEPSDDADSLDGELARLVNRRDGSVNVMIVLREDSLAALDRFRHRIPTLLNNLYRLEHLTADDARHAIERPLAVLRARSTTDEGLPVAMEPGLAGAILDDLAALDRGAALTPASGRDAFRVELPFLQVVMERLWLMECRARSPLLRRATFDAAGGAAGIVRQRIQESLDRLDPDAQAIVASVLRHLVTPSGAKIALTMEDLAGYAGVPAEQVEEVVRQLLGSESRILRRVTHPTGDPALTKYEIYHDALGAPLLTWRVQMDRRRAERVRRARRRVRDAVVLLAGLVVVAGGVAASLKRGKDRVEAREIAAMATGQLESDNGRALLLALAAMERSTGENAGEVAMRRALFEPGERLRDTVTTPVERLTTSPDGQWVVGSHGGLGIRLWRMPSLEPVAVPAGIAGAGGVSFDSAGRRLLVVTPRAPTVLTLGDAVQGAPLPRPSGSDGPVTAVDGALLADGTRALVLYDGVGVVEWRHDGQGWREEARTPIGAFEPGALLHSPDERWLAVTGDSAIAIVDRRQLPRVARLLRLPGRRVRQARFVSGTELAVATGTRTIDVFDAGTLAPTESIPLSCEVARFDVAGAEAAGLCGDSGVVLFNVPRQRSQARMGDEPPLVSRSGPITGVTLAPDGRLFAMLPRDDAAPAIWSVLSRTPVTRLRGHGGGAPAIGFLPNSRELVSVGRDSTVRTWEVVSAVQRIGDGEFTAGRARVVLDDGATRAGMVGPYGVQLWDIARGQAVVEAPVMLGVPVVAIPRTGDRIATIGEGTQVQEFTPDDTRPATRWDASEGLPTSRSRFRDPFDAETALGYLADGRSLLVTAVDGRVGQPTVSWIVRVDAAGGGSAEVARVAGEVAALASDSAGTRVAIAGREGEVQVRTLAGDSVVGGSWRHDGGATTVAFGGARAVASGGRAGEVQLARASEAGFAPAVTLGKHDRAVTQLAFDRPAAVLASGDAGGTVRIWSVDAAGERCSLEGQHADYIRALAFAPSGRTLASADEGGVAIWFVDAAARRCRFGYRLVDLESPTEAMRFAADGSALVVVGRDGVIRRYARALWAPRDSLLALARRRLRGRELTPAERARYTRLP